MLLFGALFVGCGLLVIAFARPLVLRRVPPNRIYGVKLRAAFADEWVWYEVNHAYGRDLRVWGFVQVAAALVPLLFVRPASWTAAEPDAAAIAYLVFNTAVCVAGALSTGAISYFRARRLLQERIASGATLVPKPPGL